jgi:hypothetical protein
LSWKLFARIRGALGGSRTAPEQLVRSQYKEFQELLEANEGVLERMGALGDLLARSDPFSHDRGARLVGEVLEYAERMVASLVRLSGGRYSVLRRRLEAIAAEARQALARGEAELVGPGTGLLGEAGGRESSGSASASDSELVDALPQARALLVGGGKGSASAQDPPPGGVAGPDFASSPGHRSVSAAADSIVPLGLTDPHAASFTPQGCRSVHDITRFCHEMAVREMFEVNRNTRSRRMSRVCRLAFTVPLETFVIDLGGGLATGTGEQSVRPEEIASVPFRALIAGMSTPGLPWSGAVPIELRGFAGLVLNSMIDNERAAAELGSDAYVLVSERYVNYSARMGYHFASLDAYASSSLHRNYISYRFKGGAAAAVRRVRRARFIAYVLRHWGFSVVQRVDHVDATIRKLPEPEVLALLRELGRLLGAVRNADVSMYSDDQVELYAEAFLAGACSPVDATQGKLRSPRR